MLEKKFFVKYFFCMLFVFSAQITYVNGLNVPVRAKNIEIDTSVLATIEEAYGKIGQADYLIACQEIKTPEGWAFNYGSISRLVPDTLSDADYVKSFVSRVVQNYGDFYRVKEGVSFAMSGIDLSNVQNLADNIITFINDVNTCKTFDRRTITNAIKAAKQSALSFKNVPDYIDLYSFLNNLSAQLNRISSKNTRYNITIKRLQDCITNTKAFLQAAVPSRASGEEASGACGLSIYFPASGQVSDDYQDTDFAQYTHWNDFITQSR
ncbi:MAG: clostripain-related cysteine peptidase [Candidatus Babeliales bacterium]